jgi:putative Mg2+ transporter-C (MgtC) family protein
MVARYSCAGLFIPRFPHSLIPSFPTPLRPPELPTTTSRSSGMLEWLAGEATQIPTWDVFLRLSVAVLVGGLVGFDREMRNKPAGLRTHILVSLAAALFTVITFELHAEVANKEGNVTADPIRIIEAVTAGVAFLAAGAIIRSRGSVHGLTTGANMWLAGALGVACGSGYYAIAGIATAFALIVLVLLARLEAKLQQRSDERRSESDKP